MQDGAISYVSRRKGCGLFAKSKARASFLRLLAISYVYHSVSPALCEEHFHMPIILYLVDPVRRWHLPGGIHEGAIDI